MTQFLLVYVTVWWSRFQVQNSAKLNNNSQALLLVIPGKKCSGILRQRQKYFSETDTLRVVRFALCVTHTHTLSWVTFNDRFWSKYDPRLDTENHGSLKGKHRNVWRIMYGTITLSTGWYEYGLAL